MCIELQCIKMTLHNFVYELYRCGMEIRNDSPIRPRTNILLLTDWPTGTRSWTPTQSHKTPEEEAGSGVWLPGTMNITGRKKDIIKIVSEPRLQIDMCTLTLYPGL